MSAAVEKTAVKRSLAEREAELGSGAYSQRGVALVRGEGARLWDDAGRLYLDCAAGHGVASLGHAHPRLVGALTEQASRLAVCPGAFASDVRVRFLERLAELTGMPRCFLANSGAEAVEGAVKLACHATGRTGLVATLRGFHGRTLGALGLTWERKYRAPFAPLLASGVRHVPFNDLEAMDGAIRADTAAVVVEPVQGEGGVHPAAPGYLAGLRRLCDERGALLVLDEIQTGFGRTGRWFAHQHDGVVPDLMALAKGIAGGFPMGAVAIGPRAGVFPAGLHGSTFGGNPLACAAGLATLETMAEEALPERAARLGSWALDTLRRRLASSPRVRDVRGVGLLVGIELRERVTPVLARLADDGLLALPAGATVLRLLPPLTIPEDDWRRAVDLVVRRLESRDGSG